MIGLTDYCLLRKIVVYGTGMVAGELINAIDDKSRIIGILDGEKLCGEYCGYKILSWDELKPDDDICVIIASSKDNCLTILERIRADCIDRGYHIFSAWGEDITYKNGADLYKRKFNGYCKKNTDDLISEIRKHDFISFDIFDTLIMRKVIRPEEVFELIEVKENIKSFRKARISAGRRCITGNIYDIYKLVKDDLNLSDEEIDILINKELYWEKQVITARKDVVDAYSWAVNHGKSVSLISDMYLPEKMIEEILDSVGIIGYQKLYVSCDQGARKGDSLFEIYKQENVGSSYLHIGDNTVTDVKAAGEHGIDSYYVMSAWDMYMHSPLILAGTEVRCFNDRILLGAILEVVFNSPFAFFQSYGAITVDSIKKLSAIYVLPIAVSYVLDLLSYLKDERIDGKVLFAARDCRLFYNLIKYVEFCGINIPESVYFYTSRKAAKHIEDNGDTGYKNYLNACGVDVGKQNVICEFYSKGTTQFYLNRLFRKELKGYYFCTYTYDNPFSMDISSLFLNRVDNRDIEPFCRYEYLLELFMSSTEPSVLEINVDGMPIFDDDERSESEKYMVSSIQSQTTEIFKDIFGRINLEERLSERFIVKMIHCLDDTVLEGECKEILNWKYYDNYKKKYINVEL